MANRETYPAAQSPLQGDIDGPAGATTVTVVGIQRQPVSPATPVDKDTFRYNQIASRWEPTADGNASITLGTFVQTGGQIVSKGVNISDDYDFLVNNVGLDVLVGWTHGFASQVFVNGSPTP
jgi:hypothetical protein